MRAAKSGTHELRTFDGMLARCVLRFAEDGAYQGVTMTLLPVLTSGNAPANDFRPIPAHGEDAYRIMAQVEADSGSLWQDVTSPEHLTLSLRRGE